MLIKGSGLSTSVLVELARSKEPRIKLCSNQMEKVRLSRTILEKAVNDGRVIYGVNTGMGGFMKWLVPISNSSELQTNLIASVSSNVGQYFDDEVVRAAMITRCNSLVRGHSAIQPKNLQTLVDMVNGGVIPCVPEKGSLGASGDLGPLGAIALVCTGQGRARYFGVEMPAVDALAKANIEPMKLSYKEGLALINGTSFMTGLASILIEDIKMLLKSYYILMGLTLEGLQGFIGPFDPAVHIAKNHAGQVEIANFITNLLKDSNMLAKDNIVGKELKNEMNDQVKIGHAPIEDTYSLRCAPQILGPIRDIMVFVNKIVEEELNSTNDNPMVMHENGKIIHNGNFHGQYISMAMDNLSMSLVTLCNLSERHIDRFLDVSNSNGLPPFLCRENAGLRGGLIGGQSMATSVTAEVRSMCIPLSTQTLTSTADFQDHVSLGLVAARRTRDILRNIYYVLGFELLCACQAADIRGFKKLSTSTAAVYETVRRSIPYLDRDIPMTDILEKAAHILSSGDLVKAVENVRGPLDGLFMPPDYVS